MLKIKLLPSILFFFVFISLKGQETKNELIIHEWLFAGNFSIDLPVFDTIKSIKGDNYELKDLLKHQYINIEEIFPESKKEVLWFGGNSASWKIIKSPKNGFNEIRKGGKGNVEFCYLATYIEANEWMETELKVTSSQMFEVFLDGEKLGGKYKVNKEDEDAGNSSHKIKFEKGKHLLIVTSIQERSDKSAWKIKASFSGDKYPGDEGLSIGSSPKCTMNITHLLEGIKTGSVRISGSGDFHSIGFSKLDSDGASDSWIEIRKTSDGKLFQIFRGNEFGNYSWSPKGNILAYKVDKSIYTYDIDDGKVSLILENISGLSSFYWSPDATFIIYSITEKPDKNETGVKRLSGMPDRVSWWRSRQFLYMLDLNSKATKRLTHGYISTVLQDISSDGKSILFSQNIPDFTKIPYSKQIVFRMNLNNFETDTIYSGAWSGSWSFSPDGKKYMVLGGPSMFGEIGENLSEGLIANNYDTQLYIFNPDNKEVIPITKDFNPTVNKAFWSLDGSNIFLLGEDRTYQKLFKYSLAERSFTLVDAGVDVLNRINFNTKGNMAVYTGSSISTPTAAFLINLDTGQYEQVADPESATYKNVYYGKTEDWDFKNKNGITIEGRVYYPPGFDETQKYPLIVYYYGGTNPTSRSFGGRYPKNLFASNGYVVYVLQPSGATGYGQEFSAMHVNNWGITVSDEIILGTKMFLEEHEFINKAKVGCIGASYGGFMTMLLTTRTDIFAAAISHAGISSISSYWGEGYWGYLYSAVATANSFPWNNPDIYIDQSPLFNADKINTPLLLLHGTDDTNVPPGESTQLYTALKLLGKTVEYVQVEGQNHHITNFKKRIIWQKTIIAWFDKWLKDQPGWWNDLYQEEKF